MRFFFDNCLAPCLAEAIGALATTDGDEVTHLRKKFAPQTPDSEWLTRLKSEGDWIILSGDLRITKNKHEKQAWLDSGLTAFFLSKGWLNIPLWDQAAHLVRRWPNLRTLANGVRPGAGFVVPLKSSRVEQLRND